MVQRITKKTQDRNKLIGSNKENDGKCMIN